MTVRFESIAVIGAGAWGTALALNAHRAGRKVKIWAREADVARKLSRGEGNPRYFPEVTMPPISATDRLEDLAECDAIMMVTPAQFARAAMESLAPIVKKDASILLCSKVVEAGTLKLMSEVLSECMPEARGSVLSGPSFAIDVAHGLPTAVTLASHSTDEGEAWVNAIGRPEFRPYFAPDVIGAEIGGAVKNVLAIACGAVEGMGLGRSAHAALISRGFAEMTRLAVAMGARQETLMGLCGLGDLVLTCSSMQSRNMSFGYALGQGRIAADILAERQSVTEGVASAPGVVSLASRFDVDMPICEGVAAVLGGQATLTEAVDALLNRPFRSEF